MASWYLSSGQGSVIQHLRPNCSPRPHRLSRLCPLPSTHCLWPRGGYKVSRRAAKWAEGSTQLCMASAMLRTWSPRRRLPAESAGRRRGLWVRMAPGGQPGSNPSSTSDSVCELGHTTWPPCAPVSSSGLCMDQHRAWQVMLKMEIRVRPPHPHPAAPSMQVRKMKHRYLLCSYY